MKIEELVDLAGLQRRSSSAASWDVRGIAIEAARAALLAAESELREHSVCTYSTTFMAAYADAAQICEKMAKELE